MIHINQWEKWVACGDNHGELICRSTLKVFCKFLDIYKPKYRIHLGDNWDFRNLRRGADPSEEDDSLDRDWQMGNEFLELYHPTVFLTGNHDFRLWKAANDWRGLVRHYAQQGIEDIMSRLRKLNCKCYPYDYADGVYRLGDASYVHGYGAGINACREHAQTYGKCYMGHIHTIQQDRAKRNDEAVCHSVGMMGDFSQMNYARQRTATFRWAKGWAYGMVNLKTQKSIGWQAEQIGNQWAIPTDIKIYE